MSSASKDVPRKCGGHGAGSRDNECAALASSWSHRLVPTSEESSVGGLAKSSVERAIERTIPLIRLGNEVPFLCRYRPDEVSPLSPAHVHDLRDMVERHEALSSLRKRALDALRTKFRGGNHEYEEIRYRIATSVSRSELEELYSPYKPPARGSLSERISASHPDIAEAVERFWNGIACTELRQEFEKIDRSRHVEGSRDMCPRVCCVHLLGSKIAANPQIFDTVMDISRSRSIVSTKRVAPASAGKSKGQKGMKKKNRMGSRSKYEQYFDFECRASSLRDHSVLAIRRGLNAKEIRMTNAVPDIDYIKRQIQRVLIEKSLPNEAVDLYNTSRNFRHIIGDAIDDAWSRLLKRRSSTAVWREKVAEAEQRAIACFAENVRNALMMPPQEEPTHVLAIDPGHKAGTKVALLDPQGRLVKHENALSTIHFLGSSRPRAVSEFASLLNLLQNESKKSSPEQDGTVVVALGNGHGSDDSRSLVEEASSSYGIPIDIHVVNEAGASVWSVTEAAANEFPGATAASIGAVSIGRRVQDPLSELVRVPPRSLGLGMYQHDLPEKELDSKLKYASIDAVSMVGVDGNSASLELLKNVPGLSRGKVAEEVIKARPLRSRSDLTKVKGLGPKSFENCAGFIVIRNAGDELDSTRVHPESYPLARWVLRKLKSDLNDVATKTTAIKCDKHAWNELLREAASIHDIPTSQAENVIDLLVDSGDPRLHHSNTKRRQSDDSSYAKKPSRLPVELASSLSKLKDACPVRSIVGTVRNVTDFGAFIDFGADNDGLLHISKAGPSGLQPMFVGKKVTVDIIGVCVDSGRVSLSLAGLGHKLSAPSVERKRKAPPEKPKGGKHQRRR